MKRTLSFLLSLIFVIGIITSMPVTVSAASVDALTFELNADCKSYSVTGYDGFSGEDYIVIPREYNGLPVTIIGGNSFAYSNITHITIPDSVTSIGNNAFNDCASLTSITIPDSVTSISFRAFVNTGYYNDSSNWENNVLYIGNHLIKANDNLSGEYKIKEGTKTIADDAFSDCDSLTSITIPDSVTSIGASAFSWCGKLTSITVPNSVTCIGKDAFFYCKSLTSITIPDSVTCIGTDAFCDTGYYDDDSNWVYDVLYIGNHLIKANDNLSGEFKIKEGAKTIAGSAFSDCASLTSITIPDNVISIGENAFYNCDSLTSIVIPDSVASIGDDAFEGCRSLKSINIPDGVTSIGSYTFFHCIGLESITIPDSVTSIGYSAFTSCENLTYISIPDSVASIGDSAFQSCKNLVSVKIGRGLINIGTCAFEGCFSLASISLPESLVSIGPWAFDDCHNLKEVDYKGTPSQWKKIDILTGNNHLINAYYSQFKLPTTPKLKSVSNAIDGVKVVWNAVEGADEYIVYRKTAKSGWANLGTTSEATFTDKTAKSGTTYYYTVKAQNGAGASGYNKTGLAIKYLSAPKLSKVYNNGKGNVLSWGKVTGASGYYVYRKTPSSGWSKVATIKKGTTASYTDKKVTYGKTYIYTVKAYSGKTTSSFNTNGVTILKKIPNVTISTKNVNGGKRVSLSSSISGATIYYKTSKDGKYKKYTGEFGLTSTKTIYAYAVRSGYYKSSIASKKVTVTKVKTPSVVVKNCVGGKKISFTSGTSGAMFYYKTSKNGSYVKYTEPFTLTSTKTIYVKAYKPGYATSSTASKKVSVSKIGTPTITSVKAYNDTGKIVLKWKVVSGAQGYYVYRADDTNKSYTRIATVKGGKTVSFTDTSYMPGVKNYYIVRAYCSGKATSSNSKAVSVTAPANNILADPYAFYQKAAQDIHNNGVAGYTRKGWQNIISYEYSNSANENKIKDIIDLYFTSEENAGSYVNEKGSNDCKFWMPATTTTKEYIKSTNVTKVGENYKIEIVLKDQYNPMMDDTDGIVGIAPYTFYIEDVEQAIDDDIELKSIIKQCDEAEALIKNYTITAVMTPDGKFVSISHRSDIDFSAQGKEVDGTDVSFNASFVYAYNCTDFKY